MKILINKKKLRLLKAVEKLHQLNANISDLETRIHDAIIYSDRYAKIESEFTKRRLIEEREQLLGQLKQF